MKKVFLINSYSCSDKLDEIKSLIRNVMKEEEYEIIESEYEGHLTEAARQYHNCDLISVGGDGTLFEVINGAAESDNSIFVVPAGSGNDFCRVLTDEKDYKKVLSDMASYTLKTADCGKAGDKYFTNIASVGYDAEIVKNSMKFKNIPVFRKISYIMSLFYTIFTFKPLNLKLTIDGTLLEQKVLLAAFANGEYYGGGIHIAPTAKIDDGYLDVYIVNAMSKIKLITLLPKLLDGSHVNNKNVKIIKAKEIAVKSDKPLLLNVDGELFDVNEVAISVVENGIRYYCKNK